MVFVMTTFPIEIELVTRIGGVRNLYTITVEDKSIINLQHYVGRNETVDFEGNRELKQDEINFLVLMLSDMKIPLLSPQTLDEINPNSDNYHFKLETDLLNLSILWDEGEDENSYLKLNEIRDFIIRLIKPPEEKDLDDDALVCKVKSKKIVMTWDLTTEQKGKFLELMNKMGGHSTYFMSAMVKRLKDCGIPAVEGIEKEYIFIGNKKIPLTTPEWGDPGIYPPSVLSVVIEHYGYEITTDMNGRGFAHNDRLQQLANLWGIDKDYL